MALVAPVENGKIVETTSQSSLKNQSTSSSSSMDKDTFLQLLVAQMKYQDPLEPTSNTEYVGEEVYIKTTTSTGETKYVQGKVDYVVFENNKAYLSINEELYSLSDLDTVVDGGYLNAYNKAYDFTVKLNKLPVVAGVDLTDADDIDELEKTYNEMSDYEKGFVAKDTVTRLNQYIEKLKEVRAAAGEAAKKEEESGGTEDTAEEV